MVLHQALLELGKELASSFGPFGKIERGKRSDCVRVRCGLEPHRRKGKRMDFVNDLTRIVRDVQRVVIATVDDAGMPETRAVEMLDADAEGLYFIVDRTTAFYAQLMARKSLAFTGVQGASYGECATVTLRGRVEEMGSGFVLPLLEKNEAVFEFYKNEESRKNLTVFRMYQGVGERTERHAGTVARTPLRFGDERMNAGIKKRSYFITEDCDGCRACVSKCPEGCIDVSMVPAVIDQERCTRCGNCEMACFQEAIIVVK